MRQRCTRIARPPSPGCPQPRAAGMSCPSPCTSAPLWCAQAPPLATAFALGPGGPDASTAGAMGPTPSLPLNVVDTHRFDSLLFELGPDFLPDFDTMAGLDSPGT